MTRSVKRYWKWDEKFNDTPYKLGSDINDLLQKGLVSPSIDSPSNFLGSPEGAPKYVEVVDGKVNFILFSSFKKSTFPSIAKGLWDIKEQDLIATLNKFLKKTTVLRSGDKLLMVFREGVVIIATLSRY